MEHFSRLSGKYAIKEVYESTVLKPYHYLLIRIVVLWQDHGVVETLHLNCVTPFYHSQLTH